MKNTLEVRWFFPGLPPAVVQRWFRLECSGKSQPLEVRKDWYAYQEYNYLDRSKKFCDRRLDGEEINLKLRQDEQS